MNLLDLFSSIPFLTDKTVPDVDITSLTVDSREVTPGTLFVAVRGVNLDGHQFLEHAVQRGAVAAIGEQPAPDLPIPYYRVENARLAFSELAAAWYGRPAQKLTLIGVTGTDGKTTTVNLIYHIMEAAGLKAGMISTVNAVLGERTLETGLHVTTPEPLKVQAMLAEMVEAGITHAVLEVTSHGLAQHRVLPHEFRVAVVTNITHEHLDYHGSYQAYHDAKAMLFRSSFSGEAGKVSILNRADESYADLARTSRGRIISYGGLEGDITASDIDFSASGLRLMIHTPDTSQKVTCRLLGNYNVSNILAAFAATVQGLGISPEQAAEGIAALPGIPGRMQQIDMGQAFLALVDFAHTPNALRVTLETCRTLTAGRVIAVFGSAGLRDREKRRLMAQESIRGADITILTAEDPRTEMLDSILSEMAEGATAAGGVEGESFLRIPDRGEAISQAVRMAQSEDLVVACGKGHEQSMCFGEKEYPWDDRTAMRSALAAMLGVDGPEMPYLPTRPA